MDDEHLELEAAAWSVLGPWAQKIAPLQAVRRQSYACELHDAGRAIAARVALSCGARVELTRYERLLAYRG